MKKIILFTENYEIGGNNKYMIDLALMAKSANHEVKIFVNQFGLFEHDLSELKHQQLCFNEIPILSWGELRSKYHLRNKPLFKYLIKIIHLTLEPVIWLYQFVRFMTLISLEKPDWIVCANGGYPAGGAVLRFCLAGNLLGINTLLSIVSSPSTHPNDKRRMIFWDKALAGSTDLIVANSSQILNEMTTKGFAKNRQKVIYNGIFGKIERPIRKYEKIKFVFMGRLEYAKGVDVIIETIQKLKKVHLDQFEFHFYGLGSYLNHLEQLKHEMPNHIFVHGYYKGDLADLMKNYDVLLLPSRHEGLPYVILEAMRAGCICLTSRVGGIPEAIQDNENGFLIDQIDAKSLLIKIENLIIHKKNLELISINAQKVFNDKFEKSEIFKANACIFD